MSRVDLVRAIVRPVTAVALSLGAYAALLDFGPGLRLGASLAALVVGGLAFGVVTREERAAVWKRLVRSRGGPF